MAMNVWPCRAVTSTPRREIVRCRLMALRTMRAGMRTGFCAPRRNSIARTVNGVVRRCQDTTMLTLRTGVLLAFGAGSGALNAAASPGARVTGGGVMLFEPEGAAGLVTGSGVSHARAVSMSLSTGCS
jgi:hypothetical protein